MTSLNLKRALSSFLSRLEHFKPRKYVIENLSMKESAEIYGKLYLSVSRSLAL